MEWETTARERLNRVGGGNNGAIYEKLMEVGVNVDGGRGRFFEVKACGGAAGCPLTLIDDARIVRTLANGVSGSGLEDHLAKTVHRPVLVHHRFRLAVAGCPNCCSEPQTRDFAVVGQSRPGRGGGECTQCGMCVETCKEGAVSIDTGEPVFHYDRCVNCGQCIAACPVGAITEAQKGFKILVAGRLGRHPILARTLQDFATKEDALRALAGCLEIYKVEGRPGERFSQMVDRMGWEEFRNRVDPYLAKH